MRPARITRTFFLFSTLAFAQGVIVVTPIGSNVGATFMLTENLPPAHIYAIAHLPTGEMVVLRDFDAPPCNPRSIIDRSRNPLLNPCAGPTAYPLTGSGLPNNDLPFGTVFDVTVTLRNQTQSRIQTTDTLRGVFQAGNTITIPGTFDPTLPISVYFGIWPVPVKSEAVSVSPTAVILDPAKNDPKWASGYYPITVYQPGFVCDTVLMRYRLPE